MKSYELHTIHDLKDIALAELAGLPNVVNVGLLGDVCSNCGTDIGGVPGRFVPFNIVLGEKDGHWLICQTCAMPVVRPRA
jgi:hypothetical protein